ncbi:hypothetical protein BUALT_Bualt01G0107400 [Buddleja alternifolia]|uniref:Uncharacterized protein n=1 Tax=Buddleja alternifolia TaxID=168488 RepID=A0AAV6YDX3_9LAMI|nr:hypothetical protein BUALT_Bualt01G0107400 [Buddleja alternifolia]
MGLQTEPKRAAGSGYHQLNDMPRLHLITMVSFLWSFKRFLLTGDLDCLACFWELLFSYNIAVDRSNEMKKVLGKSASSVGLQLPEVYEP